jgi:hypothetical protein
MTNLPLRDTSGTSLGIIRRLARLVLETRAFALVRLFLFTRELKSERERVRQAAEALRLPVFSRAVLEQLRARKPDATTAFILGTGASVAKLDSQDLAYITSQFSVGVNQWILHPMVPDVYAYEVDPDVRLLQMLDREDVKKADPTLLFLRPSIPSQSPNADHIPQFLRDHTFIYGRSNIWTRKPKNIGPDSLSILKSRKISSEGDILLDNGASIARMAALCFLLGFQKIVLVGVDLNNVRYFWHENQQLIEPLGIKDYETGQKGNTHETLSTTNRPFPIDEFVKGLAASALLEGVDIFIGSEDSQLAGALPVFMFPHPSTPKK